MRTFLKCFPYNTIIQHSLNHVKHYGKLFVMKADLG